MSTWHAEATRNRIRTIFGQAQLKLVDSPLASVERRQCYAQFHYQEATALLRTYVTTRLSQVPLMDVVLGANDLLRSEYNELRFQIEAHLLACVQSMHAIADTLSHVAYYSLGLNLESKPLLESNISARAVLNHISGRPDLGPVHLQLRALVEEPGFLYLNALANHSKHRSIIRTSVSERLQSRGPDRVSIGFVAFRHKDKQYNEVNAHAYLETEFSREVELCVSLGLAIDDVLCNWLFTESSG